ncbi:hypothetical protein G3N55_11845 [Dissulfurirhabdus thermomarina]|uniref:QueT transporter family protein n=1 Tax=Dissulfurirhabdus thermomarina TaxID=1765737 RepID=A0A6N9TVS9_DISTH|nr:hypothetical protein [Dissulfurirhabdus thermomarina]NDY43527.1 hypothetical protein [Dissulfurirhabdus thermomarina]NMX22818.1 hypothetical protein [Dissulfurirhabdus thermomarina]
MRDVFFILAAGFVLLVLETALGRVFQAGMIRLDGVVPMVIWHGLRRPLPAGLIPVLALALLAGVFSNVATGLFFVAYAAGYLLVRYLQGQVLCPAAWQQALLAGFVGLAVALVLFAGDGVTDLFWPWGVGQAVVWGVTAPAWFWLFDRAESWLPEPEA